MAPRDPEPRLERGCFNLDNNRDPRTVVVEVLALLTHEGLDWLCVCEAAGYIKALRKPLKAAGYRLYTGRGSFSRRDSAVIVHRSLPVSGKRVHSLGGVKWERSPDSRQPGLHHARHMVSVRIGKKGQRRRVGAVHLPPGPHNSPRFPLRSKAHREALMVLGRVVDRWSRAPLVGWELLGDFNKTPADPVMQEWLTDHDATAVGSGIDWAARDDGNGPDGIRKSIRHDHGKGDHKPRTFN